MRERVSGSLKAMVVAGLLVAAGCGGTSDSGNGGGGGPGPTPSTGWTVLVYMVADNNLEDDGLKDLLEMSQVGSGSDLRFVVQADRIQGFASGGVLNLPDWTTTKRLLVEKGSFRELGDLGEVNMADPGVLANFISWGVKAYPSEKYMLVFWDHGGGWIGFGWDDTSNREKLTLAKLNTGLSNGLSAAGIAKFDVIGFDACLMATVEVLQNLKAFGSYFIASEELEPGHGWDYAAFAGGGTLDPVALSKKVIDGFKAQATAENTVASITLSLIDSAKIDPILSAIAGVKNSFTGANPASTQISAARRAALAFGSKPDPTKSYHLVDLVNLFSGANAVTGSAALQSAVNAAVVYHVEGAAQARAKGLSIYFPSAKAYYSAEYDSVAGMDDWRAFLTTYYAGPPGPPPGVPTWASGSFNSTHAALGLTGVLSSATASAASNAFLSYGLMESAPGTGAFLLGDQPASISGVNVTSSWDWSVLELVQPPGTTTYVELAYLSIEVVSSTLGSATIPLLYDAAPGATPIEAARYIVFQLTDGKIISDSLYAFTDGGVAGLTPAAGSKVRAMVAYLPSPATFARQWVPYSDPGQGFDATKEIGILFAELKVGARGFAGMFAANDAGKGDWLYTGTGVVRP